MNIYSIYKCTNKVNGKSYIGFSSEFNKRKRRHCYDSFNQSSKEYSSKFHRAIRKYGLNNFDWEILYQSKNYEYMLQEMEYHFIVEYDTFKNGYNETMGGEGCYGYKHSDEHKEKLRNMWSGKNNPMYGKSYIRDDQHRKNMSTMFKGIQKTTQQIQKRVDKVSQEWLIIDTNGNKNIIKNLKQFCRENNLNPSAMGKVSQGKQTHHKLWKCYKISS